MANKVVVACAICGKLTEKNRYEIERRPKAKFCCGLICRIERQRQSIMGKNHPRWSGGPVKLQCAICGRDYFRKQDQVKTRNSVFCSRSCFGTWKSRNWRGPQNVNWSGGYKYKNGGEAYHGGWEKIRKTIRERDGHRCRRCGSRGRGRSLEVHHIIPIRRWDTPAEANRSENLVTLCWKCHAEAERILRQQDRRRRL